MAVDIKGGSAIALCWELFGSICSIPWLNCDSIFTEYNLQGLRVRLLLRALLLVPNSERNQDKDESHHPCWQSNMMATQSCRSHHTAVITYLKPSSWTLHYIAVELFGLWKGFYVIIFQLLMNLRAQCVRFSSIYWWECILQAMFMFICVFWFPLDKGKIMQPQADLLCGLLSISDGAIWLPS